MEIKKVTLEFDYGFKGIMKTENHETNVGIEASTLSPYDMLLGALASCYYSTFLDVAKKKKIVFEKAEIYVEGEKRTQIPTTLKWATIHIVVTGASKKNESGLLKAAELAAKYCSIYETLTKVADLQWNLEFV